MTDLDVISRAGLVPERVLALEERVRREVDEGLLPSCQFALAKDGEVVVQRTYGDATDDTRYCIFSSTKAFVAAAFWQVLAEGLVKRADPVADILPSFATNGKHVVTVEQVLLHTAGFPNAIMGPPRWEGHASRLEVYEHWQLEWEPGTRYEYHATSAHWVLADIITAVTGMDHREFVRRHINEPLGLRRFALGVPLEEQSDLAEIRYIGEEMTPDELEAAFGFREIPAPRGSLASMGDFALALNGPADRAVGIPGGGGFSTAADVAVFYQALLHNPGELWDPEILADGTARVANTLPDPLYRVPANRALGLIVAGEDGHLRGFGKTFGPRSFGHGGAGGQIALADPDTGLSFCYLTNGMDRHLLRQARRGVGIASRAGLVTT